MSGQPLPPFVPLRQSSPDRGYQDIVRIYNAHIHSPGAIAGTMRGPTMPTNLTTSPQTVSGYDEILGDPASMEHIGVGNITTGTFVLPPDPDMGHMIFGSLNMSGGTLNTVAEVSLWARNLTKGTDLMIGKTYLSGNQSDVFIAASGAISGRANDSIAMGVSADKGATIGSMSGLYTIMRIF